jgi:hypothetical protein
MWEWMESSKFLGAGKHIQRKASLLRRTGALDYAVDEVGYMERC